MTTTATIPPRIYIRGAANNNIESDFGHTASLFYIVIGAVNDLASHAMTDAVEAVRKSRHYRHRVKYHIREAQRKFDGYERMMKGQLTDRFPLFMDITDEVYEMIRPDMEKLYFSFKSELDKHREPESELKARMETAIAMLDLAVYMFDRFFDSARERTKADFRPITERVKTFEDACKELGESHPLVVQYKVIAENEDTEDVFGTGNDIIAYLKLRIVCAALNEGWEPQFTKDECRWYPLHFLITEDEIEEEDEEWKQRKALIDTGDYVTDYAGFAFDESITFTMSANTHIGSRLCLKSEALSDYYGTQFIRLWADFNLRRK